MQNYSRTYCTRTHMAYRTYREAREGKCYMSEFDYKLGRKNRQLFFAPTDTFFRNEIKSSLLFLACIKQVFLLCPIFPNIFCILLLMLDCQYAQFRHRSPLPTSQLIIVCVQEKENDALSKHVASTNLPTKTNLDIDYNDNHDGPTYIHQGRSKRRKTVFGKR